MDIAELSLSAPLRRDTLHDEFYVQLQLPPALASSVDASRLRTRRVPKTSTALKEGLGAAATQAGLAQVGIVIVIVVVLVVVSAAAASPLHLLLLLVLPL